jgi:hypothetical protein
MARRRSGGRVTEEVVSGVASGRRPAADGKSEDLLCCHDLTILSRGCEWSARQFCGVKMRGTSQLAPKGTNWNRRQRYAVSCEELAS